MIPAPENDDIYNKIAWTDPEIHELVRSIKEHGIQEPLLISTVCAFFCLLYFLAQETVEIFIFPASRSIIAMKFTFPTVEFAGVDLSAPESINFFRNHSVKHLVVNDVLEKPSRNEGRVQ